MTDTEFDLNALFSEAAADEPDTGPDAPDGIDASIARLYDDIIWASENIGGRMSKKKAGSARRYEFWKLATNDTTEFLVKYMPRASDFILKRNKDVEPLQQEVDQEETRDIAELQRFLRRLVRAADAE